MSEIEVHNIRKIPREQAIKEIKEYVNRERLNHTCVPVSKIAEALKLDIELIISVLKESPLDQKTIDYSLKDSGTRKIFESGANRDLSSGKGRFDLLPPATLRALAIHFEKGAEKYDDRNWERGIPVSRYIDSAMRHALQFADGCDDENHLIAALWNIACAYETILRTQKGILPETLYDLPRKVKIPDPYETKK